MGRDFPSIFFLLPAMVYILLQMGMCFPFPLRMQNLGNNSLLFGSFILNPRAFLNRENSWEMWFSVKPELRVKQNPCCVFLTVACKGITADVLGASLFPWGFKQWKPTGNRRFSEETTFRVWEALPRVSASLGQQNRQSCCVCEGSWTEAAPQLLWNAVSSPEQLRVTLAPSSELTSACTAPWVPCSEHEGSPGRFALLMWASPGWCLTLVLPESAHSKGSDALGWSWKWNLSSEPQSEPESPPWCALCMQWGKGDDQRRWWSRILFLCLI